MNLRTKFTCLLLLSTVLLHAQPKLELQTFKAGFINPVDIENNGDDRLFIVEKRGLIRIIKDDEVLSTPFLDIDTKVNSGASERGLLGLAFHPDYVDNGYFFVHYTDIAGSSVIARYQVSADNPDVAVVASEKKILTVAQPFSNHNAGDLAFGPDGYLYIPMGDGGSGGDPGNRSQTRTELLGKLLRINIDEGDPYSIPEDNPFAMDDFTLDEIWAVGLRNPWRVSFDRKTGDLWIADVGQNEQEEINYQPANSMGGENYGWRCFEGTEGFNSNNGTCLSEVESTLPAFAYGHENGNCGGSVTGGYVYRGQNYPLMYGHYIFVDYCTGQFYSVTRASSSDPWQSFTLIRGNGSEYSTFGEDANGELYVAGVSTGIIYRVTEQTLTSVEAPEWATSVLISPNPATQEANIQVDLQSPANLEISIRNQLGQIVVLKDLGTVENIATSLNLEGLANGVYFVTLRTGQQQFTQQLLKQ